MNTTIANLAATERDVLAVLAGNPLHTVATCAGIDPTDLTDAVATYQAAGRAALTAANSESRHWHQVSIKPLDWGHAEQVAATYVRPILLQAERAGLVSCWWYVRKAPHWRIRAQITDDRARALLNRALDDLTRRGILAAWKPGIYEPETAAFGGTDAMAIAHRLFHDDSKAILDHLADRSPAAQPSRSALGRRPLSLLLCATLIRAAGQDWHEQGDIWQRVTLMRELPAGVPLERVRGMAADVRRLLALDTTSANDDGLVLARPWFNALTSAGRQLGHAAQRGLLHRGIRDVLAHHVIFHWNRLGIPTRSQAILARAAYEAILNA